MDERVQFSIRRACAVDANAILQCLGAAFEPYRAQYTPAAFADTVLSAETIDQRFMIMSLFVAVRENGEIIGSIGCQANSAGEGHLRGMAVQPEWQGVGVAPELLRAAEDELRRQRCTRITLDTTSPLQRAMRFYEHHGYRRSGRVTDFFGMPLFEYEKAL